MKNNKNEWTVQKVCRMFDNHSVNANPDFQREEIWKIGQKQMLVDSILRGFDVPKIYLHSVPSGKKGQYKYDVIDGKQRLLSVYEYNKGKYRLKKDADNIDGEDVANKTLEELPDCIKDKFYDYQLTVVEVEDATDDEVNDMFLRLQNGTSLNEQEKRNAMAGNMKDFVGELSNHEFFQISVKLNDYRFTYAHLAAMMVNYELQYNGEMCDLKNANLTKMYREQRDFNKESAKAKKVKSVLNYLYAMFPNKDTMELNERYNVISLYILISQLKDTYAITERGKEIAKWFVDFEVYKNSQFMLPPDEVSDNKLLEYRRCLSHSSDSKISLDYRNSFLMERLFEAIPDLAPKDKYRAFDSVQKQVIYRRDKGICQCCKKECEPNNWHADHIVPWSKGGFTTINNGQVLCPECNLKKGNNDK